MNKKEFYNSLSQNYDSMIDFEAALIRRMDMLKQFAAGKKSALDFGCGTGLDSIALAKLELQVKAYDISNEMISKAKKNADRHSVKIDFNSMLSIKELETESLDLIVSLGNTIANIDSYKLSVIINDFKEKLKKHGTLLIQLLNFNLYSVGESYTINSKDTGTEIIERLYSVKENKIEFLIKTTDKISGSANSIATDLYPHQKEFFAGLQSSSKFGTYFYGNLSLEPFEEKASNDLVVLIKKF